jgi:hypothetical protein
MPLMNPVYHQKYHNADQLANAMVDLAMQHNICLVAPRP